MALLWQALLSWWRGACLHSLPAHRDFAVPPPETVTRTH
jgi:hypothetical protein